MGRQTTRLTLDNLERLPGGSAACVCWELDPVRREQVRGREAEEKAGWVSWVLREWGSCGRVVCIDDQPVGHAIFAPSVFLPGTARFATAPASQDAVVLATAHIAPEHREGGLGRMLVQGMAKDLIRRGDIGAVEAFGALDPAPGECILPVDFLLAVGFKTHRPHPTYPRMRMDLRTAITWKEEFEVAVSKLLGVVGKRRDPVPEHRVTRVRDTGHTGG